MLKEGLWGDSPDFDGRPAFPSVNTYLLLDENLQPNSRYPWEVYKSNYATVSKLKIQQPVACNEAWFDRWRIKIATQQVYVVLW